MSLHLIMGITGILMTLFGVIGGVIFMCISTLLSAGMWSLTITIPGILLMIFADGES